MAKTKKQAQLEQIVFVGKINNTSNKTSDEFKNENPTKAVYINFKESEREKIKSFDIPIYTPKNENAEDFIVIRAAQKISVFVGKEKNAAITIDCKINAENSKPNFKTDTLVKFSVIKSEKAGNTFTRLIAIGVKDLSEIIEQEFINPFMDISLEDFEEITEDFEEITED